MDEPISIAPPKSSKERDWVFLGHSVVNGVCALSVAAMHIFGSLDSNVAVGVIAGIAGLWGFNTRKGPPSGNAGVFAVVHGLYQVVRGTHA